ncbi:MAG: O-antigen ligase family protein [Candidatus Magasanikbacteria bacterium]|nr:O-antigen ligase family protein [Candidatus Magasanikbacteria bacterium]MCA9389563.1 O-antigen ligase family protein [Candidatus Magasanikbacteria bacterium]MCA9390863.1 O-antigen ligase family protein [Candidatus Magasanikbacteria bacterium]
MFSRSLSTRIALGLGLFVALFLLGFIIGTPLALAFLASLLACTLLAWREPYLVLFAWAPISLMIGWVVSLDTGEYRIGEQVLHVYAEISVGELLALSLLAAWALRLLFYWKGRRDLNWKPWFPILLPFSLLFLAELVSMFSPALPSKIEVVKHAIRYIGFIYLSCIVLVANFVRSKKRLKPILGSLGMSGALFAIGGLISMVYSNGVLQLGRAMPLPILGVNALGGNQHALAETLIIGMGALLALGALSKSEEQKKWIKAGVVLMFIVTLFTFSRTAWIVLAFAFVCLCATVWRPWWQHYRSSIIGAGILLSPIAIAMVVYTLSSGAMSSVSSRNMIAAIGFNAFKDSPVFGVGAGGYLQLVGNSRAFFVEFGPAFDAHGIIQKVAGELGGIGLLALGILLYALGHTMWKNNKALSTSSDEREAYMYLCILVASMFLFECFSTTYWTPRLWLPVGLVLAASRVFVSSEKAKDPDFLKETLLK